MSHYLHFECHIICISIVTLFAFWMSHYLHFECHIICILIVTLFAFWLSHYLHFDCHIICILIVILFVSNSSVGLIRRSILQVSFLVIFEMNIKMNSAPFETNRRNIRNIHFKHENFHFTFRICIASTGWRRLIGCSKLQVVFAKPPLIIGLFCGKWPVKIRHSMTLRHPCIASRAIYVMMQDLPHLAAWGIYA